MNTLFLGVVVLSAQLDMRDVLPDRLAEVIESRAADTSEIKWTLSWNGGRDDGLVERFTTRTAGETILESNRGDAKGLHRVTFHTVPPQGLSRDEEREYETPPEQNAGTRISLAYDGQFWRIEQAEAPLQGRVMSESTTTQDVPLDFAAAGLAPYWSTGLNSDPLGLPQRFLVGLDSAEWTQQRSGRFEIVTAEFNGRLLEWMLDSRQGGAPVRAALYRGDRLLFASETDLAEVDGRWVPTSIRFYRGDNETPSKVIDVHKATFDEPWHAKEITPNDLGLLFGTQIFTDGEGLNFWSGTELLSQDEYQELVYVYRIRPDERVLEMLTKAIGQTVEEYLARIDRLSLRFREEYYQTHGEAPWLSVASKEKDEWDLYVEKFIKKHKFDEPRIKRARAILDRAKKLRDVYLRKHISDIRKAERRRDTKKLAVFDAHTERVFERVLVRGLKRLVPKKPTPKKTASKEQGSGSPAGP